MLPDGRFGVGRGDRARDERRHRRGRRATGWAWAKRWAGGWTARRPQPALSPAHSLLLAGVPRTALPVTVHVAIGTDTPHTHPAADGAAIGSALAPRFPPVLRACVADLNDGGVYLNVGSAVVLPEVFLKAVSAVRNLGHPLADFTTANFDFLQHYRPRVNVVERPHAGSRAARLRHHRPPRVDDSAAGGGADREGFMSEESRLESDPAPGRPPSRRRRRSLPPAAGARIRSGATPTCSWFAGLAMPCMLAGLGGGRRLAMCAASPARRRAAARGACPAVRSATACLFGALLLIFRLQYDRPFWRSLGWTPMRMPFLWIVILRAWRPPFWCVASSAG